jgi:hypothetical protein
MVAKAWAAPPTETADYERTLFMPRRDGTYSLPDACSCHARHPHSATA